MNELKCGKCKIYNAVAYHKKYDSGPSLKEEHVRCYYAEATDNACVSFEREPSTLHETVTNEVHRAMRNENKESKNANQFKSAFFASEGKVSTEHPCKKCGIVQYLHQDRQACQICLTKKEFEASLLSAMQNASIKEGPTTIRGCFKAEAGQTIYVHYLRGKIVGISDLSLPLSNEDEVYRLGIITENMSMYFEPVKVGIIT